MDLKEIQAEINRLQSLVNSRYAYFVGSPVEPDKYESEIAQYLKCDNSQTR